MSNKPVNFPALVQTFITCIILSACWGKFCVENEIGTGLRVTVSFIIGLFVSRIIYNWLDDTPPNTTDKESEPPEEL